MCAKKGRPILLHSPVAGSSLSLSSLTVAVTGAFIFDDELSITTRQVFQSLLEAFSGRVTTSGASLFN